MWPLNSRSLARCGGRLAGWTAERSAPRQAESSCLERLVTFHARFQIFARSAPSERASNATRSRAAVAELGRPKVSRSLKQSHSGQLQTKAASRRRLGSDSDSAASWSRRRLGVI